MDVTEIKLSNMYKEGCVEVHIKINGEWWRIIREVEGGEISHYADVYKLFESGELEKVEY